VEHEAEGGFVALEGDEVRQVFRRDRAQRKAWCGDAIAFREAGDDQLSTGPAAGI
jgi:hypothetical protein